MHPEAGVDGGAHRKERRGLSGLGLSTKIVWARPDAGMYQEE